MKTLTAPIIVTLLAVLLMTVTGNAPARTQLAENGFIGVSQHMQDEAASVTILDPASDTVITAGTPLILKYRVVPGPKGDHVHVYVDGREIAILRQLAGTYTVGPLSPGVHSVAIKVVNRSHVPIGVESSVTIQVQ